MHKINIQQFRRLYAIMKEDEDVIILLLSAGVRDFIEVWKGIFLDYPIDRKTIRTLFQQHNNVDVVGWKYWTNDSGILLLNL